MAKRRHRTYRAVTVTKHDLESGAVESKHESESEKKRERTEAEAWKARMEWVHKNRYYLAGALGAAALVVFWPRSSAASTSPALPPPPPTPTFTAEDVTRYQASQQAATGVQIGTVLFAVVAAGTIYWATSDTTVGHPPPRQVINTYSIETPMRPWWSSWVSDW